MGHEEAKEIVNEVDDANKRAKTTIKEKIGKVLIDVGKLIFGSIFLGVSCAARYHKLYWQ